MTRPGPAAAGPRTGHLVGSFLLVVASALAVSLASPVATVVLGVVLLGVLHAVLELRYLAGRFSAQALRLGRPFLRLVVLLLAGIVISRLLGGLVGRPGNVAEILLGYAIIAVSVNRVLERRHWVPAWALTGLALAASLLWPAHHFVALAHLHLAAVVIFLWEWSRRLPSRRARRVFRSVQVGWAVVLPLLILAGYADAWLGTDATFVRSLVGDGHSVVAGAQPPGGAGTITSARFLAVFAFLQSMHLLTWVVFFPRWAPDAAADLEERLPWLTGARVWAIGFLAAAALAVLLVSDYPHGVVVHDALTSPHVYVEVPLVLALLGRRRTPDRASQSAGAGAQGRDEGGQNLLATTAEATYGRGKHQERR
ncbi:hypothetical protein [Intrasporangium sp. DVR]|uniref:hypothetical protein n=1 Tax=Intrasporangium sp. DVR TaxID=3127867 RepID=UPI00313A5F05